MSIKMLSAWIILIFGTCHSSIAQNLDRVNDSFLRTYFDPGNISPERDLHPEWSAIVEVRTTVHVEGGAVIKDQVESTTKFLLDETGHIISEKNASNELKKHLYDTDGNYVRFEHYTGKGDLKAFRDMKYDAEKRLVESQLNILMGERRTVKFRVEWEGDKIKRTITEDVLEGFVYQNEFEYELKEGKYAIEFQFAMQEKGGEMVPATTGEFLFDEEGRMVQINVREAMTEKGIQQMVWGYSALTGDLIAEGSWNSEEFSENNSAVMVLTAPTLTEYTVLDFDPQGNWTTKVVLENGEASYALIRTYTYR